MVIAVKGTKERALINISVTNGSPFLVVKVNVCSKLNELAVITVAAIYAVAEELKIINVIDEIRILSGSRALKAGGKCVNGDATVIIRLDIVAVCEMFSSKSIVRIVGIGEGTTADRNRSTVCANSSTERTACNFKSAVCINEGIPTAAAGHLVTDDLTAVDSSLTCANTKCLTAVRYFKRTAVHNKRSVFG